jgi:hypothetical protein
MVYLEIGDWQIHPGFFNTESIIDVPVYGGRTVEHFIDNSCINRFNQIEAWVIEKGEGEYQDYFLIRLPYCCDPFTNWVHAKHLVEVRG